MPRNHLLHGQLAPVPVRYQVTAQDKKGKELYVADTLTRAAIIGQPSSTAKQKCKVFRLEIAEMDLEPKPRYTRHTQTNKRNRQRPSSSTPARGYNEWVAFRKKGNPRATEAVLKFQFMMVFSTAPIK